MNSRQRVLAILERKPVDRLPVDIWHTPEVVADLQQHTGKDDLLDVYEGLGIDKLVWLNVPYAGPLPEATGEGEVVTHWGQVMIPVQAGAACYLEYRDHPFAAMETIEDLDAYPWWPDPHKFDYDSALAEAKRASARFATLGPWVSFFEIYCGLRGLEQAMLDLLVDPDFVDAALDRIESIQTAVLDRFLREARGHVDAVFYSDDMGSQNSLLMSLENWDEFIGPRVRRWCDLIHGHGARVFYHSDGAIHPLIPRMIEAGIDILNPIQANCPGMDFEALARDFAGQVIFHGGVDTQKVLPFGTPQEVRELTRRCMETLGAESSGLIVCSCHNIQAGTPVPNILAMVDEVRGAGALAK